MSKFQPLKARRYFNPYSKKASEPQSGLMAYMLWLFFFDTQGKFLYFSPISSRKSKILSPIGNGSYIFQGQFGNKSFHRLVNRFRLLGIFLFKIAQFRLQSSSGLLYVYHSLNDGTERLCQQRLMHHPFNVLFAPSFVLMPCGLPSYLSLQAGTIDITLFLMVFKM